MTIQQAAAMAPSAVRSSVQIERRARFIWVGIVVLLLSLQLSGGIVTVYLAVSDPTVAVIPNYYQAGLDWDIKRRSLDQFVQLGWQYELIVDEVDPELPQRKLLIKLSKNDQPVGKQRVSARIYHHARGSEVHQLQFDESWPGEYVCQTKLVQSGLWHLEFIFEGAHGIAEARQEIRILENEATVSSSIVAKELSK
jgi:nitrogen fixation protein FixH